MSRCLRSAKQGRIRWRRPSRLFRPTSRFLRVKNPDIAQAKATDSCGVLVTNDAPAVFPLGTTVVTWTAIDPAGNVTTAMQRVTAILGDDVSCCPSGTNIIVGTNGHDVLHGTPGSDCILGLGGDDVITGAGGDDFISGGAGRDTIYSGTGNDVIFGAMATTSSTAGKATTKSAVALAATSA